MYGPSSEIQTQAMVLHVSGDMPPVSRRDAPPCVPHRVIRAVLKTILEGIHPWRPLQAIVKK